MSEKVKKPLRKKVIKGLWILFIGFIVGLPLFMGAVSINFLGLFGSLPDFRQLENPETSIASELFTADGKSMGKYFRNNRTPVQFNELSKNVVNALIATEDIRFYDHSGVDYIGLARAGFGVVKYVLTFGTASLDGGGSTVTQQLAKNLFRTRGVESQGLLSNVPILDMVIIKAKEWIVAAKLERSYTKEEIIAMYLNTFEFGGNSFGIKTAAKTFFNKEPNELAIQEAAVLIGLCKNPNYYSPVSNPENSLRRRNTVLAQMHKYDFLTTAQFDSLKQTELILDYKVQNQNEGLATYFRGVVAEELRLWAISNGYDIYEDGLRIYTTIDSRMQQYAEEAVANNMKALQEKFIASLDGREPWIDERGRVLPGFLENSIQRTEVYKNLKKHYGNDTDSINYELNRKKKMKVFSWNGEIDTLMSSMDSLRYYKHFLQTGFMAMDPHTGHIKAWVGGINFKYFKFDHVRQSKRQPGSTFKAFVYAASIESGYSPCYQVIDQPETFQLPGQDPPTWTPPNSNGVYSYEKMTIRKAMANSVNSITAHMMKKVGPRNVAETAKRIGITSELEPVPALSLGVNDVSLFEMVGAYGTFVNEGEHIVPFYITRIEDKYGNPIEIRSPQKKQAMSEEDAYLMLYMLRGATEEEGGTGMGLSKELRENNEIGGKTGTTQNASDGWFMGVTKDLVAGAWVGGDDRAIHFRNWYDGQGARTARPIWSEFMTKVYQDSTLGVTKGEFKKPARPLSVTLNCDEVTKTVDEFNEYEYGTSVDEF